MNLVMFSYKANNFFVLHAIITNILELKQVQRNYLIWYFQTIIIDMLFQVRATSIYNFLFFKKFPRSFLVVEGQKSKTV